MREDSDNESQSVSDRVFHGHEVGPKRPGMASVKSVYLLEKIRGAEPRVQ